MKWQGFIGDDFYIVNSKEDLKDLLVELTDDNIADVIQKLIDATNYNRMKLKTDLTSYEAQLEEQRDDLNECVNIAKQLISEIHNAKRVDRKYIISRLSEIVNKGE
jgi:hypothetical protein